MVARKESRKPLGKIRLWGGGDPLGPTLAIPFGKLNPDVRKSPTAARPVGYMSIEHSESYYMDDFDFPPRYTCERERHCGLPDHPY